MCCFGGIWLMWCLSGGIMKRSGISAGGGAIGGWTFSREARGTGFPALMWRWLIWACKSLWDKYVLLHPCTMLHMKREPRVHCSIRCTGSLQLKEKRENGLTKSRLEKSRTKSHNCTFSNLLWKTLQKFAIKGYSYCMWTFHRSHSVWPVGFLLRICPSTNLGTLPTNKNVHTQSMF